MTEAGRVRGDEHELLVALVTETLERAKRLRLLLNSNETYVTQFVTPHRLKTLAWDYGDGLEKLMAAECETLDQKCEFIDSMCASLLGKPRRRARRSDYGGRHMPPEDVWKVQCQRCARKLYRSRWDAQYCSNACRQAAYRQRAKAAGS
jgi:hypothetical protein